MLAKEKATCLTSARDDSNSSKGEGGMDISVIAV